MRGIVRSGNELTSGAGRSLIVGRREGADVVTNRSGDGAGSQNRIASIGDELRSLIGALWRRKHWIALTGLLSLLGGLTYLAVTPPRYLATAQILIDPRSKRVVEGAVVQGGFGSSAVGADTLLIDSQVELVTSNTILRRVAEELTLATDPEFAMTRGEGIRIKLRNWLGRYRPGFEPELAPIADPLENAIYRLRDKHLSVRRVGNTYVMNVAVFSELPDKSARLANAIANAYVRDQVSAATDTTRATTALLQARIAELRTRLEVAERAVEDYRGKSGLIGTSGGLVNEQQLQSVNEKLSVARTATALAKARFDIVRELTPTSAVLSAQSEALRSPVILSLRQNLARLDRRVAVLQQTLGPRHPDFAGIEGERRSVLALIGDELGRIRTNAQSEYELTLASEKALTTEFGGLQQRASTDNQAGVKLRELSREAQSARQVYEAFLNRVKETREQEDLAREQSRIIGAATVPAFAASPPTALVLIGSLAGGLGLGAMLAWLAHVLERPQSREIEQNPDFPATDTDGGPDASAIGDADRATVAYRQIAPPRDRGTVRIRNRGPEPATIAFPGDRPRAQPPAQRAAAGGEPDQRRAPLRLPVLTVAGPGGAHLTLGAGQVVTFADHIAAVDTDGPDRDQVYTLAVEAVLADVRGSSNERSPSVAVLIGVDGSVGTSSAALAMAYRSAMLGRRTLLIDAALATAELSLIFASEHVATRAGDIATAAELRALLVRDARSGLSLLPLAATEPDRLDDDATRRLIALIAAEFAAYDCVLIDAGHGQGDSITPYLLELATRVLVVCPEHDLDADLARVTTRALGPAARKARILATLSRRRSSRPMRSGIGRDGDDRPRAT